MMEEEEGYALVDVRTFQEYFEGHIPEAINIPLETIAEELPDTGQLILVYCRSGVRSKKAASALAELGYQRVYEFGGINDWKGEIVTEMYTDNPGCSLIIEVNGTQLSASLEHNEAAQELIRKLRDGQIELQLSEYGNFEKVGPLPWPLPAEDETITTKPGDILLYEGDQLTIYYSGNTWSFTRLAHIPGITEKELRQVLGEGDVTVTLFLDWWDY